ncbi:hypothetical protein SDC9_156258 [bioreactor metagenome]|uniref:Uncharacterized protein n=1 Tax=bioreactor metagenome TaxID=1076179 RepID=A0A645F537_9ZZZZ
MCRSRLRRWYVRRDVLRHHVGVHVEHHPQRTGNADGHEHDGEDGGQHGPAAFDLAVHVQEEHHVNDDLHHGKATQHQHGGRAVGDDVGHDQPERDGRQDDRQDEARHIAREGAVRAFIVVIVAVIVVVMTGGCVVVCCAHQSTPIR